MLDSAFKNSTFKQRASLRISPFMSKLSDLNIEQTITPLNLDINNGGTNTHSSSRESSSRNPNDHFKFEEFSNQVRSQVPHKTSLFDKKKTQILAQKPEEVERQKILSLIDKIDLENIIFHIGDESDSKVLVELIKKHPKKMTEIKFLGRIFQEIRFFADSAKKLSIDSYNLMIKKLRYEFHPKNTVIYRKDDQPTKFYVVIRGKCASLTEKEKQVESSPGKRSLFQTKMGLVRGKLDIMVKPKNKIRNEVILGTKIEGEDGIVNPQTIASQEEKLSSLNDLSPEIKPKPQDIITMFQKKNNVLGRRNSRAIRPQDIEALSRNATIESEHTSPDEHTKRMDSPTIIRKAEVNDFEIWLENNFPYETLAKTYLPGTGFGELGMITNMKRTANAVTLEDTHFAVLSKEHYEMVLNQHYQELYKDRLEFLQRNPLFNDWGLTKISALMMMFEVRDLYRGNYIYNIGDKATHFFVIQSGEVDIVEEIKWEKNNRFHEKIVKAISPYSQKSYGKEITTRKVIIKLTPGCVFGEEELIEHCPRKSAALVSSSTAQILCLTKYKFDENIKRSVSFKRLHAHLNQENTWKSIFKEKMTNSLVETIKSQNQAITKIEFAIPEMVHNHHKNLMNISIQDQPFLNLRNNRTPNGRNRHTKSSEKMRMNATFTPVMPTTQPGFEKKFTNFLHNSRLPIVVSPNASMSRLASPGNSNLLKNQREKSGSPIPDRQNTRSVNEIVRLFPDEYDRGPRTLYKNASRQALRNYDGKEDKDKNSNEKHRKTFSVHQEYRNQSRIAGDSRKNSPDNQSPNRLNTRETRETKEKITINDSLLSKQDITMLKTIGEMEVQTISTIELLHFDTYEQQRSSLLSPLSSGKTLNIHVQKRNELPRKGRVSSLTKYSHPVVKGHSIFNETYY